MLAQSELDYLRQGTEAVADRFCQLRPRLLRIIHLRMDRRVAARIGPDDVLQDVYLEVSRRIQSFLDDAEVPFFVWVRTLTLQVLLVHHRKHLQVKSRNAALEVPLSFSRNPETSTWCVAARLIGALTSPSEAAVREEQLAELSTALANMEPIDREVLVMRHLEELSNQEVAHSLGLGKHAASKRYIRALERLAQAMSRFADRV